ncbi:uncharacterized protein LOC117117794 [Anneissia japonica]|uniref:uncharacterized protein LOC117117794 n=1 Tax=Anneissia japonica TaxID=1529436 RepID=UPI00142554ED|nr:uncharacterized protein LOC117117794 [Anneissia japonica]
MDRTILVTLFLSVLMISNYAYILEHPQSMTRLQGETVVLNCRVNDTKKCSIYWYRVDRQEYISEGLNVFTNVGKGIEHYSITGNVSKGEFNLEIQDLSVDDDGKYNCGCYSLITQKWTYSIIARLTILAPPDANQPTCLTTPPQTEIIIGQNISFICESFGGKPAAKLEWTLGNTTLPGIYEVGVFPKNTYYRTITAEDKGAVFVCKATSPAIRKVTMCKIGPLRIQHHAEIRIKPREAFTLEGGSISFTCSHLTDKPLSYKSEIFWKINGNSVLTDTRDIKLSMNHKTIYIGNIKKSLDLASVRCELKTPYQLLAYAEAKINVKDIKIPRMLVGTKFQSTAATPTETPENSFLSLDPNEKRGFFLVILLNAGGIAFLALLIIALFCTPKIIRKCRTNQKQSIPSISGSSRSSSSGYREVNYSHRNQQASIVNHDEMAHLYAATDDLDNISNRNSLLHTHNTSQPNATLHIVLHSSNDNNDRKPNNALKVPGKTEESESFYMIPNDPPVPKYPGRYDTPAPKYPERLDVPAPKYPERSDDPAPKYPERSDLPAPQYQQRYDLPAPKYPGRTNSTASSKNPFLHKDQSASQTMGTKKHRRHSTGEKLRKPKQYANVDYDNEDDPFLISY